MKRRSSLSMIFSKLRLSSSIYPERSPTRPTTYHDIDSSDSIMEESIEKVRFLIARSDVVETSLVPDDQSEARQYVESVKDLQDHMRRLIRQDPNSEMLVRAHGLMEAAMKRLEEEFRRNLSSQFIDGSDFAPSVSGWSSAGSSVSDYSTGGGVLSEDEFSNLSTYNQESVVSVSEQLANLKAIADCMVAAGYGKECITLYKSARKSIVDEELNRLGIKANIFSKQDKKPGREVLEGRTKSWVIASKVAVRSIFHRERVLSSQVFSGSPKIGDACFSEVTRDGEILVFNSAENLARHLKKLGTPEMIFHALDMYEEITNLWPELDSLFSSDSNSAVQSHCVNALTGLRDAVRKMLTGFESIIQKDSSKTAVPAGGGVHPLTRYVMDYLAALGDYGDVLQDIVAGWPLNMKAPLPELFFTTGTDEVYSEASTRLAWLVLVLLSKLDAKAELYKRDVALSYLFLANNLHYLVAKVGDSNLKYLLGQEWIRIHESRVMQYASSYERIGWHHVFSTLPDFTHPKAEVSLDEPGNLIGSFNAAFQETYRKHATWVVPNPYLRDHIKASLKNKLGSGYRALYGKYSHKGVLLIGRGESGKAVIRFTPEGLDNYLSELFSG